MTPCGNIFYCIIDSPLVGIEVAGIGSQVTFHSSWLAESEMSQCSKSIDTSQLGTNESQIQLIYDYIQRAFHDESYNWNLF